MKKIIANQSERVGKWVCEKTGGTYTSEDSAAIGLEQDGVLIAGVMFDNWNGASIAMHVAAAPGAKWMTRDFLHFCFWYPFEQLKVNKIIGLVDEANQQARRFDEHMGFKLEARIKGACVGGDLLIYTMDKTKCRFLGDNHGRKIISTSTT